MAQKSWITKLLECKNVIIGGIKR